ncbi:MAG: putative selenium-dependent hydroxylase accessory protein YqeC [Deltaproteobacteria bacterium]|nr:putative selenium-dependent hydroxylase accessory protein YqeC [Deltaproteobacteria bacterium]
MTLKEALGLKKGEMLSLIGAGGKTTTLFCLAHELWEEGGKVLVTTTTKIFKPTKPHVHKLYLVQDLDAFLIKLAKIKEPLIIGAGSGLDDAEKLVGLPTEWFDVLQKKAGMDSILIEADGAAMKPFKVPADHEPVVPEECDLTVWVMGIKILGQPLATDWVHRAERAAELLRLKLGAPMTEELILRLVEHPQGCLKGIPPASRRAVLINQADSAEEVKKASELGRKLIQHGLQRVVITSYLASDVVKEVIMT